MKASAGLTIALCSGVVLGAATIQALHAQARPVAYTIAEFEVNNADKFKAYGDATTAQIPRAGGKFVARGGKTFVVAGDAPKRVVIVEWPSLEKAQAYFESAEYKQLVAIRDENSKFRSFVIEGLER